jgi:hypothetical protein
MREKIEKTKTRTNKFVIYAGIMLLIFITALVPVQMALAQNSDTVTGTVTVGNAAPVVSDVELVDSAYASETNLLPNNTDIFGFNATIADANTLDDLTNVSFYIFDDSVHGAGGADDWNSLTPNGYDLIRITWTETGDSWAIAQGSNTEWTMQTPQDPGADSALTTYEFTARFDASRATTADTDWNITVLAYDDQDAFDTDVGALYAVDNYFEISWSSSTFAWGSVTSLSTNNTMVANITVTIRANAQWEVRLLGGDFTAGGEGDVDIDTNDTVVWDENGLEGGTDNLWLRNSYNTLTGTFDNQAAYTDDTSPISRDVHMWFTDVGFFTTDVEYEIIVTVLLQANT